MALRAVPDHPKFAHLKGILKLPKGAVLGYLECIWHFTGRFTPQGNIGKYDDLAIESWTEWDGKAGALIEALIASRWIDRDGQERLLVHDWPQHADKATKQALTRANLDFCVPTVYTCVPTVHTPGAQNCDLSALPVPVPVPVPEPEPEPEPEGTCVPASAGPPAQDPPSVREVLKTITAITHSEPPKAKRGTRFALEEIPSEWLEWAILHCSMDKPVVFRTFMKFKNYWVSKARDATKVNWFATWQNWCLEEVDRQKRSPPSLFQQKQSPTDQAIELVHQRIARGERPFG